MSEVAALVPMHNICDMVGIPEGFRRPSPTSPNSPTVGAIRGSGVPSPLARVAQAIMTVPPSPLSW